MTKIYKTISKEVIDQQITVGDVIDNPHFDANLDYRIVSMDEDGSWIDLYDSKNADNDPPADLLVENVTYMTLGDNKLILEVRR